MARVLIVDDQPDVVRILEIALRAHHEVFAAYDGAEALRRVAEHEPQIVLLDVSMPVLDGYRVLHRLKSNPETREIVVIMLTARAEPEDTMIGLSLGADFYVAKPFFPQDVAALVRTVSEGYGGNGVME